jgi:hypothetical protein
VCEFTNLGSSSIKNKLAHQTAVSIFLHGHGSNLGVFFTTLDEGLRQYLGTDKSRPESKFTGHTHILYYALFIFNCITG